MCELFVYSSNYNRLLEDFSVKTRNVFNYKSLEDENENKKDYLLLNCSHYKINAFIYFFDKIIETSRAFHFCNGIIFVCDDYEGLEKILQEKNITYLNIYDLLKCNFTEYIKLKKDKKRFTQAYFSIMEYIIFTNTRILGEINKDICNIIKTLGIPIENQGIIYLKKAIEYSISNSEMLEAITKELYPLIAIDCDVYPETIERAIRDSIHRMYDRLNLIRAGDLIEDSIMPSNKMFISFIYEELLILYKIYGFRIEKYGKGE